jgi:hypothetical protein
MRPILLDDKSVNQIFPSGPLAIPKSKVAPETGIALTTPAVVDR